MEDSELIDSILNGNIKDFERLIKMYESNVFNVAIGLLHNKEDAEEVTQDVFLKVYQSISSFNKKAAFSTWLYRIAINTSLNFLRRKRNRLLWSELTTMLQFASKEVSAESNMIEKSDYEFIKHAIDSLPKSQRVAWVLTKYEELPQKQVASIMRVSQGAVEQLVIRAKNNLRKKLTKAIGFESTVLSNNKTKE